MVSRKIIEISLTTDQAASSSRFVYSVGTSIFEAIAGLEYFVGKYPEHQRFITNYFSALHDN